MAESDPVGVRAGIVSALELDLVGPGPDDSLATEILPQAPSRWYLTGFLAPVGASAEARTDETVDEELELEDEAGGTDDAVTPDPPAGDVVVLASGSAARAYAGVGGSAPAVSIGPETSRVAQSVGLEVAAEAATHDLAGLVAAVRDLMKSEP